MKIDSELPSVTSLPTDDRVAEDSSADQPLASQPIGGDPRTSRQDPPGIVGAVRRPAPFDAKARTVVVVGVVVLGFLFLLRVSSILTPFLWAIVMAYILNPLVGMLCKRSRMPRLLAVMCVYLVGVGAIAGLLFLAIPRLNAQLAQLTSELPSITADLQARYFGSTGTPLNIAGFSIDVAQVTRQVADSLNSFLNNFFGSAVSAVVSTVERITQLLLFIIVTFYLLLDAEKIGEQMRHMIPPMYREEVVDVATRMNRVLRQYMQAQLVLIGIMGTASLIVLTIMGVRFAVALAPIVGVMEIFPIIGPFAAIAMVTIMALFSPPPFGLSNTASAIIVALVFFILRQVEDYAVIPNIVGHAVKLHPALILFAVASGTVLGGPLGLFLAVPLTGALKVLVTHVYQKLVPA
jgi:predicted PurR-regulated permease PerM